MKKIKLFYNLKIDNCIFLLQYIFLKGHISLGIKRNLVKPEAGNTLIHKESLL